MQPVKMTKLWALSLGIVLLWAGSAEAQTITTPTQQEPQLLEQVMQQLKPAKVVYLGETHNSAADHKAQLEIIQELHRQNPKIAIAMEMFQRPFQPAIDEYLSGKITEAELLEKTEYNKRWGFPWQYYAPILQFAQQNNLPVLALNTPAEITRKVARQGLENLTAEEKRQIPPFSEIRLDNQQYRQIVLDSFQAHTAGGHGSSTNFDNFFLAQVLWDETMAETIANFIKTNPDYQVIVIAGQGHIIYGYGIPDRVARRLKDANIIQRLILLNPDTSLPSKETPIADYFWQTTD